MKARPETARIFLKVGHQQVWFAAGIALVASLLVTPDEKALMWGACLAAVVLVFVCHLIEAIFADRSSE